MNISIYMINICSPNRVRAQKYLYTLPKTNGWNLRKAPLKKEQTSTNQSILGFHVSRPGFAILPTFSVSPSFFCLWQRLILHRLPLQPCHLRRPRRLRKRPVMMESRGVSSKGFLVFFWMNQLGTPNLFRF